MSYGPEHLLNDFLWCTLRVWVTMEAYFLFNIPNTASLPQNKAVKLYEIITFRN